MPISTIKNTKLFVLFSNLTVLELKKMKKFVASPYFNQRKEVVDLFNFLAKTSKKKQAKITKANLYKELFPKEPYKDERLRLAMSQLVQLIETFLVIEADELEEVEKGNKLIKVYRKRGLEKPFEQTVKSVGHLLEKRTYRSHEYYFNKYQFHFEQYSYGSTIRTKEQNLQEISDTLDVAFIILKLRQVCSTLSHQTVFYKDYEFGILPHILTYVQEKELLKIPAISFYYHYYLTLIGQEMAKNFYILKDLIFKYDQHFPTDELGGNYIAVINVCIRLFNNGNLAFKNEFMDLYKKGLETEALLDNGVLSRFTYQNIFSAGMLSGDYDWTRNFLKDYKNKVEKEYRESAYRFNLGRLAYSEKNYDEALDLLRDTDHKDLLINLFSKTLLLKIYYELQEIKLLESFLDAFQIYLRRKKVIGYHKENYQNVIYYTQKLIQLNPYDKAAKKVLATQIQQEEKLLEKKWLMEQLNRY